MSYEKNIPILKKSEKFFIYYKNRYYDLSPPSVISMTLPPSIVGFDFVIREGSRIKDIQENLELKLSDEWFFYCDAKAEFKRSEMSGFIYRIEGEQIKIKPQDVWICDYLKFFFEEPPAFLFLKLDSMA